MGHKVLDGKMTPEQVNRLARAYNQLFSLLDLPYGKQGKLNFERSILLFQRILEKEGRFHGWQRDPFLSKIMPYDGPYQHRDVISEKGKAVGGVFTGVGTANMELLGSEQVKPKLKEEVEFDCIVVTPGEMGFKERRIAFPRVVEQGEKCHLTQLSPSYAPQALVDALATITLDDNQSLIASMDSIHIPGGGRWLFRIRTDEATERNPYMLGRINSDCAVDKDQPILWRIEASITEQVDDLYRKMVN